MVDALAGDKSFGSGSGDIQSSGDVLSSGLFPPCFFSDRLSSLFLLRSMRSLARWLAALISQEGQSGVTPKKRPK